MSLSQKLIFRNWLRTKNNLQLTLFVDALGELSDRDPNEFAAESTALKRQLEISNNNYLECLLMVETYKKKKNKNKPRITQSLPANLNEQENDQTTPVDLQEEDSEKNSQEKAIQHSKKLQEQRWLFLKLKIATLVIGFVVPRGFLNFWTRGLTQEIDSDVSPGTRLVNGPTMTIPFANDGVCADNLILFGPVCIDPNDKKFVEKIMGVYFKLPQDFKQYKEFGKLLEQLKKYGLGVDKPKVPKRIMDLMEQIVLRANYKTVLTLVKAVNPKIIQATKERKLHHLPIYQGNLTRFEFFYDYFMEKSDQYGLDFFMQLDENGNDVVSKACYFGCSDILEFLLSKKDILEIHLKNSVRENCIFHAAMDSHSDRRDKTFQVLKRFLSLDTRVHLREEVFSVFESHKKTKIMAPSSFNFLTIAGKSLAEMTQKRINYLTVLFDQGASPDATASNGFSLLDMSIIYNELQVADFLIRRGADITPSFINLVKIIPKTLQVNQIRETHKFTKRDWFDLFTKKHQFFVKMRGGRVYPFLHLMSDWKGDKNDLEYCIGELIRQGAAVNAKDDQRGLTPLEFAIENKNYDMCHILLARKDVEVTERMQQLAQAKGMSEISNLIKDRLKKSIATVSIDSTSMPTSAKTDLSSLVPKEDNKVSNNVSTLIINSWPIKPIYILSGLIVGGASWGLKRFQTYRQEKKRKQQEKNKKLEEQQFSMKLKGDIRQFKNIFDPIVLLSFLVGDDDSNSLSISIFDKKPSTKTKFNDGDREFAIPKHTLLQLIFTELQKVLEKTYCQTINFERDNKKGYWRINLTGITNLSLPEIDLANLKAKLKEIVMRGEPSKQKNLPESKAVELPKRKTSEPLEVKAVALPQSPANIFSASEGYGLGLSLSEPKKSYSRKNKGRKKVSFPADEKTAPMQNDKLRAKSSMIENVNEGEPGAARSIIEDGEPSPVIEGLQSPATEKVSSPIIEGEIEGLQSPVNEGMPPPVEDDEQPGAVPVVNRNNPAFGLALLHNTKAAIIPVNNDAKIDSTPISQEKNVTTCTFL